MTEREVELEMEIGAIKGDMKAVIASFYGVISSLGIDIDSFKKKDESISDEEHSLALKAKMPSIVSSLTMALMGGGFNSGTISKLTALAPIFQKYKYLASDIIPQEDGKQ